MFNTWKTASNHFWRKKKKKQLSNKIDLTREKNQKVLKVLKVVLKKKKKHEL